MSKVLPELDISTAGRKFIDFNLSEPGSSIRTVTEELEITWLGRLGLSSRNLVGLNNNFTEPSTILWLPPGFRPDNNKADVKTKETKSRSIHALISMGSTAMAEYDFTTITTPSEDIGVMAEEMVGIGSKVTKFSRGRLWLMTKYEEQQDQALSIHGLTLYPDNMTVIDSSNGENVPLTKKEFTIFQLLVENRGRACTVEEFYKKIWGEVYDNFEQSDLRVHINRIRNKLKEVGYDELVQTKWNVGYIIE